VTVTENNNIFLLEEIKILLFYLRMMKLDLGIVLSLCFLCHHLWMFLPVSSSCAGHWWWFGV